MDVGIEGQVKKQLIEGCSFSSLSYVVTVQLLLISVSTVLLHYMKDSYLLCLEWPVYPWLILFQVLMNLKAFHPKNWTVFTGPMACKSYRHDCKYFLFICVGFCHITKCYIDFQGVQRREDYQQLANPESWQRKLKQTVGGCWSKSS